MIKQAGYQDIDGERLHLGTFSNSVDGEVLSVKTRKQTLYFSVNEAKRLASKIMYMAKQGEAVG